MNWSARAAREEIITWAKEYYQFPAGGLARGVGAAGRSPQNIFNDLGDYLPFFALSGEKEFCARELAAARAYRRPDGLLPGEFKYFGQECVRAYEHSDYLLGLLDLYEIWPTPELRAEIILLLERLRTVFFPARGPHSWFFPRLNWAVPVADSRDGIFVEIFLDAANILAAPQYQAAAIQLADYFLASRAETDGLLPTVQGIGWWGRRGVSLLTRGQSVFPIIKYNSNWWYALLALWRVTGAEKYRQALHRAADAVATKLSCPTGAIQFPAGQVQLVHNFPVIDWLADCAYFLAEEKFINQARRVADFWLTQQHPLTGLVPQREGENQTDLDTLTDLGVAWRKVAEVSGEEKYRLAADRLFTAVWQYHRSPATHGYAHSVRVTTGAVIDPWYKVKFVCLWMKALLLLENGGPIFTQEKLWRLLRDR